MKRLINQLLGRTDAPEADDLALVVTLKSNGPDPAVIDVNITGGIDGVADPGNTTDTPLLASTDFTGVVFDTLGYTSFSISCLADAASKSAGLTLVWTNGTNNEAIRETYYISGAISGSGARTPFVINGNHRGRYFQIEYSNGALPQTVFELNVFHRAVPVEDQLRTFGDWGNTFVLGFQSLGIGEVIEGIPYDTRDLSSVEINILPIQASAANGLSLQWSNDAIGWTTVNQVNFTLTALQRLSVELPHLARFFRLVYTNGAVAGQVTAQVWHRKVASPNCKDGSFTPVVTRTAIAVASTLILPANPQRVSALIANYSPGSTTMYVKLGSGASIGAGTESFTAIVLANGHFRLEIGEYYGPVYAIQSALDAAGAWLVTETVRGGT
jgi:hypothetical protein